jgi:hypothetical protein
MEHQTAKAVIDAKRMARMNKTLTYFFIRFLLVNIVSCPFIDEAGGAIQTGFPPVFQSGCQRLFCGPVCKGTAMHV